MGFLFRLVARSIPAWAGEPRNLANVNVSVRVYPRVGGGTQTYNIVGLLVPGLSPRGRGNHNQGIPEPLEKGSIPAWAGEPGDGVCNFSIAEVYPPRGRGNPRRLGE